MKRVILVFSFIFIASSFAFGQQKNAKLEAELIEMDKAWTAAELRGDLKTISMYIADDFWGTTAQGVVENKAQYLKGIKATKDTDVADDFSVRFFGDVAVMTHRGTVKGEQNLQYRSTHVWVNRGGKWQIVAHHGSEIAPAAAPSAKSEAMPAKTRRPKIAPATASAAPVATDEAPK